MHVELFSIGPVTIYSYGLMMALAMVSAVLISMKRSEKHGLDKDHMFNMAFFGIIGGVVGAKVLYYLVEIDAIINDPSLLLDFANGFVVYGGIAVGFLIPLLYCRKKKLAYFRYLDIAVPTVAMAQGIGRIGCFLAGCCYGKMTSEWYGVVFPDGCLAPGIVPRIPTQLISAVLDFALAAFLFYYTRMPKAGEDGERKDLHDPGQALCWYLLLYAIGRFLIEFIRDDDRGFLWIFSTSQWIALVVFILAIIWQIKKSGDFKKRLKAEAEARVAAEFGETPDYEESSEEEDNTDAWTEDDAEKADAAETDGTAGASDEDVEPVIVEVDPEDDDESDDLWDGVTEDAGEDPTKES